MGFTKDFARARSDILSILKSGLEAADPYKAVRNSVRVEDRRMIVCGREFSGKRIKLLAFGKAAESMASALNEVLDISEGLAVTNAPSRERIGKIRILKSSHPVPDELSVRAGEKTLALVQGCKEDTLFVLISGGGSVLLELPAVPLRDMQKTTEILLGSGCDIKEMNVIRKHLSRIKGGQLAVQAAQKDCTVISLIISDIIGDPIDMIASGPTAPDPTTFEDAIEIAKKHHIWERLPESIREHLISGTSGRIPETPKQDNPVFQNVHNFIIANNKMACEGALKKAEALGYNARILTTEISGEAREKGRMLAQMALDMEPCTAVISGGETTVTVRGRGKGGRNQEMVLSAVPIIAGKDVVFASIGTDGIDGPTDAAGAIADGLTLKRAAAKALDVEKFLENNDSYNFFAPLGDLIITGPTGTNVMDVQAILKI